MIYEKLRKHTKPHKSMEYLWNCSIKKMAEYLNCDYVHLSKVLTGNIQAGSRLEKDIWELVELIKDNK